MNLNDQMIINWLFNSKHSEIITEIFIGVGYLTAMILAFFAYIRIGG